MEPNLSYKLPEEFIDSYRNKEPNWGFGIGAGNSGSELNFIDKYSGLKPDGSKERWWEVVRRCIEGVWSIYIDYMEEQDKDWDPNWVREQSQDMYERMFNMKWMPPGRGLQFMGSYLVNGRGLSDALYNCSFISTGYVGDTEDYDEPFCLIMIQLFSGIGTGFDVKGAGKIPVVKSFTDNALSFVVPDTREGWVESVRALLRHYFYGESRPIFDYTQIRPAGSPIQTFGGICPGYRPLERIHEELTEVLEPYVGLTLDSRGVTDVINIIGKGVVSGGQRRSAQLGLGERTDADFMSLKNWNLRENERRMGPDGWGNLSNNTLVARTDEDYSDLVNKIVVNGEPGLFYIDVARTRGRMVDDPKITLDMVEGINPCAESQLLHCELCNLADVYPTNNDNQIDFIDSAKCALLYCKFVTLLPTSWDKVNKVVNQNRRIGISVNGITQFLEKYSDKGDLLEWMDCGYQGIQNLDVHISDHLDVPTSISLSAEKPNGNTSIVAGVTPGVHYPVESGFFVRRIQYSVNNPLVGILAEAGYDVEPASMDSEHTVVISFPMEGIEMSSERDVSLKEKLNIAADVQHWWADQAVSATFTFLPDEADQIADVIKEYGGHKLKTLSFLPLGDKIIYPQQPIEKVSKEVWDEMRAKVKPIDFERLYAQGEAPQIEAYCTNDSCVI